MDGRYSLAIAGWVVKRVGCCGPCAGTGDLSRKGDLGAKSTTASKKRGAIAPRTVKKKNSYTLSVQERKRMTCLNQDLIKIEVETERFNSLSQVTLLSTL